MNERFSSGSYSMLVFNFFFGCPKAGQSNARSATVTWESADALQQGGGFAAAAPAPAGWPSRCGLTGPSLPALFSGPRTVYSMA